MAQRALIQQTIKVKKVIKKAQSKFGKASVIVPFNGKDEFLGLNDRVDEDAFAEGKTYKVGIAVSKQGKRYIEEIVGEETIEDAPPPTKAVEPKADSGRKYVDNSAGQREGAIGHYASRLVVAFISIGKIETEEEAVKSFHRIKEGIEKDF
jgi:hypothetical protein